MVIFEELGDSLNRYVFEILFKKKSLVVLE
jgi:hypothetical protein